ncbi:HlyD family efflux transporter periplasmic adaptor subunit [Psychromonas sp. SP041]|uniref:efflux RND transporter periplasmic adaptor subunit n=1 Tax=Psychromonas sp. SP041 TaxID=1365007 RepID=UPI00041606ED|nr:HlyD family efflux transporter periplasmic adaptor subunit [Psychromonas sp. SP041]
MKNIAQLLQLEENCRNSEEIKELAYIIVNETRELVSYDQGILLSHMDNKLTVEAISDVSVVETTSPFTQWINDVAKRLVKLDSSSSLRVVNVEKDLTEQQKTEMKDFSPMNLLWVPLKMTRQNIEIEYYLLLFKNTVWQDKEKALLKHIASSYRYFLFSLYKSNFKLWRRSSSFISKYAKFFVIIIILLMFLPIRLTVLSPLEVKAKDPVVVTSPLNGAVDTITVLPDQVVKKGDLLVKLESVDFKNSYIIAERTFEVAKAQLHTTKQNSFIDYKLKSKIAGFEAEVKLKKAEMDFAKIQFDKTIIKAEDNGTIVINDPNEWSGKPVVVGEKILLIANKQKIQIQIMLPVTDAIFLNDNALVKIFFDNDPLNTWNGKISQIYYEPELTPQSILSYKIIADFDQIDENGYIPKIGLRGTAKIYSDKVTLFFYLFKKPITSIRQWVGW